MEFRTKGSSVVAREIISVACSCKMGIPIYTKNNKKYIDLDLSAETAKRIRDTHEKFKEYMRNKNIQDPLSGTSLRVKVPWTNRRVVCKTDEHFYDIVQGDRIKVNIEFCGVWNVGDYSGMSWKLTLINKI